MVGEREREGRREDGRLRRGCERAGRTENRLRSTQQAPGGGPGGDGPGSACAAFLG